MDSSTPKERALEKFDVERKIVNALTAASSLDLVPGAHNTLRVLDARSDAGHRAMLASCDDELSDESWDKAFASCPENCSTTKVLASMDYDAALEAHRFISHAMNSLQSADRMIAARAKEADPDRYEMARQRSPVELLAEFVGHLADSETPRH